MNFINDIPDNILMSQNKQVLESNDYRPGKSYLADDLYTKVPGTKNRYDYTKLQELYELNKANAIHNIVRDPEGNILFVKSVITTGRIVGYVKGKDGKISATNQLTIHYKKRVNNKVDIILYQN